MIGWVILGWLSDTRKNEGVQRTRVITYPLHCFSFITPCAASRAPRHSRFSFGGADVKESALSGHPCTKKESLSLYPHKPTRTTASSSLSQPRSTPCHRMPAALAWLMGLAGSFCHMAKIRSCHFVYCVAWTYIYESGTRTTHTVSRINARHGWPSRPPSRTLYWLSFNPGISCFSSTSMRSSVFVCVYTRMSDREDAPSRTRQDQQTQQTDHHPRPTALERTVGLVRSLHPLLRVLLPRGVLACAMCTRACVSNVFDHGPPSPPLSHPPIHLPTHTQTHALTPAQQVNRRLHAPRLLHARHGPVRVHLQRGQVVLARLLVVRPGRRLLLGRLPMVAMGGGG